jgi:hypothetical protein
VERFIVRKYFLVLAVLFLLGRSHRSIGQEILDTLPSSLILPNSASGSSSSGEIKNNGFVPGKISSGVQLGTFFNSFSGNGSSFSTYVTPHISYSFNYRLRINAGITIINSSLYGIKPWYSMNQESSLNGNFTNALIFVSGDYLVNDRLKVSGSLFKEFNLLNSVTGYNPYRTENAQGAFMRIDYKVFENFHIEAGFGYSKGVDPWSNYMGYPYSNSPFIH